MTAANRKYLIAFTAALAALVEIIDTSIVNVALTEMQASLGATLSEVSWVITSYAMANVIILPMSAWLGERFGKKRYFVFSLVGFTAASVLCGMANSLWLLVLARVLQGLTGGGLMAKAQAILFETFPREEQGKAQAIFGITATAGPAIGPTLGGYLVTHFGWRWIFYVNLPVGILATVMAVIYLVPDEAPKLEALNRRVDWLGIALLATGLGSLQYMLEEGNSEGWFDSWLIIGTGTVALIATAWFVYRQLTIDYPVVDLRVLRHKALAAGCLFSVMLGLVLYGTVFAVPLFAQGVLGYTAQDTGMVLLPSALVTAAMMPVVGKISSKLDPRLLIAVGALILVGALLLFGVLSPQSSESALNVPLMVRSIGMPLMFLPLSLAAIAPLPKQDIAKATGVYNLTRTLGGSMGIAMLSTILSRREVFHAEAIGEHLGATDPRTLERLAILTQSFMSRGFDAVSAKTAALSALAGQVRLQASVMSFNDTFHVTAVLMLLTVPFVFLLGKGGGKLEGGGAH